MTRGYLWAGSILGMAIVTGLAAQQAQNRANAPGTQPSAQADPSGLNRTAAGAMDRDEDMSRMTADQRFLTQLYRSNLFEIQFSQLVLDKNGAGQRPTAGVTGPRISGTPTGRDSSADKTKPGAGDQNPSNQNSSQQGSTNQGAAAANRAGADGRAGAGSADVNHIAQMLIDDHTKANEQVMRVAQARNLTLSKNLAGWQQAKLRELSMLPAEELNNCYVFAQVGHHHIDQLELQYQAAHAQDAQVKQLATQLLPTIQTHLQHVNRTAQQLIGSTAAGSGSDAQKR